MTTPSISIVRDGDRVRVPVADLIDEMALAEMLGVSRSTLQSWRYTGKGPRYLKLGRLVRYRNADVADFLDAGQRGQ